jgi:hypothetical protein
MLSPDGTCVRFGVSEAAAATTRRNSWNNIGP